VEAAVDWKITYIRDRQTELTKLSKAIDHISRVVTTGDPEDIQQHIDELVRLRQLREGIRDDIEELGWTEPREWLAVSSRIEYSLRVLREAVERSSDWFAPALGLA
jgi:DNA-directed RNA polymerase subunit F